MGGLPRTTRRNSLWWVVGVCFYHCFVYDGLSWIILIHRHWLCSQISVQIFQEDWSSNSFHIFPSQSELLTSSATNILLQVIVCTCSTSLWYSLWDITTLWFNDPQNSPLQGLGPHCVTRSLNFYSILSGILLLKDTGREKAYKFLMLYW